MKKMLKISDLPPEVLKLLEDKGLLNEESGIKEHKKFFARFLFVDGEEREIVFHAINNRESVRSHVRYWLRTFIRPVLRVRVLDDKMENYEI